MIKKTGACWHKRQVGIVFRLCIYGEKNEKLQV